MSVKESDIWCIWLPLSGIRIVHEGGHCDGADYEGMSKQESLKECVDQCIGTHNQILYGVGKKRNKCYCYMSKTPSKGSEKKQCKGGEMEWEDSSYIQYAFNEPG